MLLRTLAKAILPLVYAWARQHEGTILRTGSPLNAEEMIMARRAGVRHPERIRTLVVGSVPPRLPPIIRAIANKLSWGPSTTAGMALGYGIFLRADQRARPALLIHELAHIAQYERLGFRPFLKQYVQESLTTGYPLGVLEEEAQRVARHLS